MFCVKWSNVFSEFFTVTNGVRQGGIMSSYLFNIYMNDLSVELNQSGYGCHINGVSINHIMYADDSCVIAPSPKSLQKLLNICDTFARDNCVLYNEKKSKCMVFKPQGCKITRFPSFYLNGKVLKYTSCHKYLGVLISDDCSDDQDIKRQLKALYVRGNMLCHKFRYCSDGIKKTLFRTYCSSNYGCELWCRYKKGSFRDIMVGYNNIFRKLMRIQRGDSISNNFVNANIDGFRTLVRKAAGSLRKRLCSSDNSIIHVIMSSNFMIHGAAITVKWNEILYGFT